MHRDLVLRSRLQSQDDIARNAVMLAKMEIGSVLDAVQSRVLKILVYSFEGCEWCFSSPLLSGEQWNLLLMTDQFCLFLYFDSSLHSS